MSYRDEVIKDRPGRYMLIEHAFDIAARAELERAAAELKEAREQEPVAWVWNDELGIRHASAGSKKPVWLESSASAEYIKQANLRPIAGVKR